MTRQMADDEVLRVLDFPPVMIDPVELRAARAAVAALQAERDALRAEVAEARREMAAVWDGMRAISPWSESNDMAWSDEVLTGALLLKQDYDRAEAERDAALNYDADTQQPDDWDGWKMVAAFRGIELERQFADRERAESALEALRGQVEGLVGGLRAELAAGGEDSNYYTTYELGRINEKRRCADQLDSLLAIKERMG